MEHMTEKDREALARLRQQAFFARNPDQDPERVKRMDDIRFIAEDHYLGVCGHVKANDFTRAYHTLWALGCNVAEYLTNLDKYSRREYETRNDLVKLLAKATAMVDAIDPNESRNFHPHVWVCEDEWSGEDEAFRLDAIAFE